MQAGPGGIAFMTWYAQPWLGVDDDKAKGPYFHIDRMDSFQSNQTIFDANQWDVTDRNLDSTVSLSQYSVATTATADMSTLLSDGLGANPMASSTPTNIGSDGNVPRKESNSPLRQTNYTISRYGTTINEKHVNYILMYDMLTGIRIAVHFLPLIMF
jgi:hypothetical protein